MAPSHENRGVCQSTADMEGLTIAFVGAVLYMTEGPAASLASLNYSQSTALHPVMIRTLSDVPWEDSSLSSTKSTTSWESPVPGKPGRSCRSP